MRNYRSCKIRLFAGTPEYPSVLANNVCKKVRLIQHCDLNRPLAVTIRTVQAISRKDQVENVCSA